MENGAPAERPHNGVHVGHWAVKTIVKYEVLQIGTIQNMSSRGKSPLLAGKSEIANRGSRGEPALTKEQLDNWTTEFTWDIGQFR